MQVPVWHSKPEPHTPLQQLSSSPPHISHLPLSHAPAASLQLEPSAIQTPPKQQAPEAQLLSGQHSPPGEPQGEQIVP